MEEKKSKAAKIPAEDAAATSRAARADRKSVV